MPEGELAVSLFAPVLLLYHILLTWICIYFVLSDCGCHCIAARLRGGWPWANDRPTILAAQEVNLCVASVKPTPDNKHLNA